MRLANHLIRHPSGTWHFRVIVPKILRHFFGKSVVKRSLKTCEPLQARIHAHELALRYAALFALARRMVMPKPSIADILASHAAGQTRTFGIERDAQTGQVTKLQTNGSADDNAAALEALKIMFASPLPPPRATAPAAALTSTQAPAGISSIELGEASRKYLKTLRSPTPPKTITQKAAAVNGLCQFKGLKAHMHELTRTDVADWIQTVRDSGIANTTIGNKTAYLKAFFKWGQGAGHFPQGDNPAEKQITPGKNEKRQRLKYGFRAFTPDDLAKLYDPVALRALNEQTRWGALIGLYTGARVGEVGQLALEDFFDDPSGVWVMRITDDGEGQSVKNEASKRTIPVHPHLVQLGLKARIEHLHAQHELRLFPRAKAGSVNGMGNWLSKSFGDHVKKIGLSVPVGKLGFHSLRKTVIQTLKDFGVREEARKEYVGHELEGEHHARYGRLFSPKQLLEGVGEGPLKTEGIRALTYGFDLAAISDALAAPPPKITRRRKPHLNK